MSGEREPQRHLRYFAGLSARAYDVYRFFDRFMIRQEEKIRVA